MVEDRKTWERQKQVAPWRQGLRKDVRQGRHWDERVGQGNFESERRKGVGVGEVYLFEGEELGTARLEEEREIEQTGNK